jgi:hypothetical protein
MYNLLKGKRGIILVLWMKIQAWKTAERIYEEGGFLF